MKKGYIWGIVIVLLVIAAVVIYYVTRPPKIVRPIKVGVIDCYSGPAAVFGKDALNGFKLALEEINKEGVLGAKIEFTTRDTKFKVDIALLPVSGTYVMTADQAVEAALAIQPKLAIPMHYGAIVGDDNDALAFEEALKGQIDVLILPKA